jgi:alkanesulfonate monooxygenase SsuD/methylene tetrahydromethanopterin reductase-like flavin-dependent oxidoreductase (luciferase family)
MKFGNFLFPDSRDPARDGIVIDETLREAMLSDELGIDTVWLGEHHFDGICAYADPIALAGALAIALKRASLGFAVLQTSLHHPIRLAEQIALLDNLMKGLIVGLGRGSSYNIYDYQGFGIDHHEAQARLDEAEDIIVKSWTEEAFRHDGRFWQLDVPILRPRPYTKPYPPLIRGSSGDASLVELARQGRPFLMNVQSYETTARRVALYATTTREAGYADDTVARNLEASWVWRNVFVAATDAEAERIALPAFDTMTKARAEMRNRIFRDTGMRIEVPASDLPGARNGRGDGVIHGSSATVAEDIAALDRLGIGGIIAVFRMGPMPHELAAQNLSLFMREVAPHFRR